MFFLFVSNRYVNCTRKERPMTKKRGNKRRSKKLCDDWGSGDWGSIYFCLCINNKYIS